MEKLVDHILKSRKHFPHLFSSYLHFCTFLLLFIVSKDFYSVSSSPLSKIMKDMRSKALCTNVKLSPKKSHSTKRKSDRKVISTLKNN